MARDHPSAADTAGGEAGAMPDWAALNLIGGSRAFRDVLALLQRWAAVDATVLLCGETGTGKELAARAIHYCSARCSGPFVPMNCGAMPDGLVEDELFGHVKGAFTDARRESLGIVGQADGGTLFLDEIDSLNPHAQAAILRFVQDRSYRQIGAARLMRSDVRLIAATNADLRALAHVGRFREDLLFRLNLLTLTLPPLREREGDALILAETFVRRFAEQYRLPMRLLDPASVVALQARRAWPGNVRELEHCVHRAVLVSTGPYVSLALSDAATSAPDAPPLGETSFAEAKARAIAEFESRYVRELLLRTKGNLSLAARLAGKDRSRFGRLVKKHGVQRADFAEGAPKSG